MKENGVGQGTRGRSQERKSVKRSGKGKWKELENRKIGEQNMMSQGDLWGFLVQSGAGVFSVYTSFYQET